MSYSNNKNVFQNKPSTSTPNTLPSGRKPIHPEGSISPIPIAKRKLRSAGSKAQQVRENNKNQESDNEEELEHSWNTLEDERRNRIILECSSNSSTSNVSYSQQHSSNLKTISRTPHNSKSFSRSNISQHESVSNGFASITAIGIAVTLIAALAAFTVGNINSVLPNTTVPKIISIEELKQHYPLQLEDTWIALESGIDEITSFNKPSVFLLLYKNEADRTVNKLLASIGKYATCNLNGNCETQPIILRSSDLSTADLKSDYGHVINKYKPELEKRAVMIVKNLDKVPGEVAQAFHSMCDEYTPLVDRTAFFFTMKVDSLENSETDLQLVEDILRRNWNDLEDDIFYPLFTRISSMVLKVIPEKL